MVNGGFVAVHLKYLITPNIDKYSMASVDIEMLRINQNEQWPIAAANRIGCICNKTYGFDLVMCRFLGLLIYDLLTCVNAHDGKIV